MAIKKVKLPNNTTQDINDARVVSDAIAYIGAQQGSATYVDGGQVIDVTTKADKVSSATSGNFAGLDSNGNLTDSGHKHSDYQAALVSGTNIKTINNQSLLGSGNITIQGGSGGSGTVTSVAMTVPTGLSVSGSPITTNGTLAVSFASGYSIPTTTKQGQWDAKQAALVSGTNIKTINSNSLLGSGNISVGTYSKPSGGIPATDLASAVQTSLGKADTALQSYTETDPVFSASAAHGISSTDISNWNAKQKAITVSSSAPTSSQGSNGDIWIVV